MRARSVKLGMRRDATGSVICLLKEQVLTVTDGMALSV